MRGIDIPIKYPKVWADQWPSEEPGYSFMKSNTFLREKRPWIRGLLELKALASRNFNNPVQRDSWGKILLNSHVMQDIFDKDREFINLAMVLSYLTSSGLRGQEFVETGLENNERPRGFLVDENGECWFGGQQIKPENITRTMTFIPSVIPREISDLLLKYLIVVCPGITELYEMLRLGGPGCRSPFSSDGPLITRFPTHYSISSKTMTSNRLLEYRDASYDMHQVLGLGPAGNMPLIPIRLRNRLGFVLIVNPETAAGPLAQNFDMELFVTALTNTLHEQEVRIEKNIEQTCIRAMSKVFVALEHHRPSHTLSPLLAPLELQAISEVPQTLNKPQESVLLPKLREFLCKPDAKFNSQEQRRGLKLAWEVKTPCAANLNPGKGKKPENYTIMVCPYKVLLTDQINEAKKLSVSSFRWMVPKPSGTMVVPPDTHCILHSPKLKRITIDKFHDKENTQDWRPQWENIPIITALPVQNILLSATIACGLEEFFARSCGLLVPVPTIKSYFQQPAHCFAHFWLPPGRDMKMFLNELQVMLTAEFMSPGDQGIIFRACHKDIEDHSKGSSPDCEKTFMMSTTTCINGINSRKCAVVIFIDFFLHLVLIAQGVGQGGRDGQETLVLFITSASHKYQKPSNLQDMDPKCILHDVAMLNERGRCYCWGFGLAFNGVGQKCAYLKDVKGCQECDPDHPLFRKLEKLVQGLAMVQPLGSPFKLAAPSHHEPRPLENSQRYAPYPPPAAAAHLPVRQNPISSVLSHPGRSIDIVIPLQGALQSAMDDLLMDKLIALGNLSKHLCRMCPACWALHGSFCARDHSIFANCKLGCESTAATGMEYSLFQPHFKAYTVKTLHLYENTTHPCPGGTCTHPLSFKQIVWAIFKTLTLWSEFLHDTKFPLNPDASTTQYGEWLTRKSDGMVAHHSHDHPKIGKNGNINVNAGLDRSETTFNGFVCPDNSKKKSQRLGTHTRTWAHQKKEMGQKIRKKEQWC
ncbi:hypothetical protein C8J57DRAFT_1240643 [Mycena rebaudengoi]|nr:hypothetical protein C8J57DRAFT_1240643 [Mycena rebaudengoi]